MTAQGLKRAAHRPSRRREIIDAATVVFAREGYAEANVEDIAQAAGVAPTAIYYHFGGKEELFAQALRAALNGFSDRIFQVRPDTKAGSIDSLRTVVRAGWDFWYATSGRGPAGGALLRREHGARLATASRMGAAPSRTRLRLRPRSARVSQYPKGARATCRAYPGDRCAARYRPGESGGCP